MLRGTTNPFHAYAHRACRTGETGTPGVRRSGAHGTRRDESARRGTRGGVGWTESPGRGVAPGERRVESPTRAAGAGREAIRGSLLQGPAQGSPQALGTQAGPGALYLPDPANARPVDRPSDRGATARAGLSLLRRADARASGRL